MLSIYLLSIYLVERPSVSEAAVPNLVDDLFGDLFGGTRRVGGDRQGGATAHARLVLLRERVVPPRPLSCESAIATQVLGADLCASMRPEIVAPVQGAFPRHEPPKVERVHKLMRESILDVRLAHQSVLTQQDAMNRVEPACMRWRARRTDDRQRIIATAYACAAAGG